MRILSFDIGGTAVKAGVVDENGQIIESREFPTEAKKGGEALMEKILAEIGSYDNIDRVGISTAGQVDTMSGKIIFASENLPGWTGMEIKKRIENKYNIPTAVENDVNAAAIGEAYYGAGKEDDDFLCLTFGTGVGGAIVSGGKIFYGATGSAGEFGHMITHFDGEECNCGGAGCYERYASATALVKKVKKTVKSSENIDGRYIFKRISEGDEEYKNIVDEWIKEVLMGLVNLIHIFNPSLIVLGGGIMQQEYILNRLNEDIKKYVMPNYDGVKLKQALLGNNAGLLGASILAKGLE